MKFLFSTSFSSREEAQRLLPLIAESGFDGVEPTLLEEGFPAVRTYREDAAALRKLAEQAGIALPSMRGGPLFWPRFGSSDPLLREEAASLAGKAAEAVRLMGGQVLLIVPGRWEPAQLYAELYTNALETARRVAEAAEESGITIGLENVDNGFLLSPSEWRRFLDETDHPRIRCYYDVGNTVYAGLGYPEQWIRELGRERICRIHVKDATRRRQLTALREGEVHWPSVAAALEEIGYDGWIGAELQLPAEAPLAFLRKTRQTLRDIWGA